LIALLPSFTAAQAVKPYCLPLGTAKLLVEDAVRAHTQDTLINLYQARVKRDSAAYFAQGRDFRVLVSNLQNQLDNLQQQNKLQAGQLADRLQQKEVDDKRVRTLKTHKVVLIAACAVLGAVVIKQDLE